MMEDGADRGVNVAVAGSRRDVRMQGVGSLVGRGLVDIVQRRLAELNVPAHSGLDTVTWQ
jgi:hypothetical protein